MVLSAETSVETTDDVTDSLKLTSVVIMCVLSPFIVVLNILVLTSTAVFHRLHTPQNMLLASLAAADLLMGVVTVPLLAVSNISDTERDIREDKYPCLLLLSSVLASGGCSLHNLLLLTVERTFAVMFPLKWFNFVSLKRVKIIILLTWTYTMTVSMLPIAGYNRWQDGSRCNFYIVFRDNKTADGPLTEEYVLWTCCVSVSICIGITLLLNIWLCLTLTKLQRRFSMSATEPDEILMLNERSRVIRVSFALFSIFVLFWLPFVVLVPISLLYEPDVAMGLENLEIISEFCLVMSAATNAPIYTFTKSEYKEAYRLLLAHWPTSWAELRNCALGKEDTEWSQITMVKDDYTLALGVALFMNGVQNDPYDSKWLPSSVEDMPTSSVALGKQPRASIAGHHHHHSGAAGSTNISTGEHVSRTHDSKSLK